MRAFSSVHPPQAGAQQWRADVYRLHATFVHEKANIILDVLAPQKGERILDLGCGSGELTLKLHESGCSVVGVDAAPDMVKAAQALGVEAQVMDGHSLDFADAAFDAVFSNAALHWMKSDPQAVADGVFRCLKSGGRFVGEFGAHGNVAAIQTALAAELRRNQLSPEHILPWYYPTVEEYSNVLQQAGFSVDYIESVPRPVTLPTEISGWLETFAGGIVSHIPEAQRGTALESIVESLRPALQDSRGTWTADYVRLRFRASKPGREQQAP